MCSAFAAAWPALSLDDVQEGPLSAATARIVSAAYLPSGCLKGDEGVRLGFG